jgi:predicted small metal-binding protein
VARAETEQEILELVAEHAQSVHGLEVTEELVEQVRSLIKDE